MADENTELRAELERRRRWFFETQLRGLNLQTFRGIDRNTDDLDKKQLLELISEPAVPGAPVSVPGRPDYRRPPPVYLDSHEPVWDADELTRRETFRKTLLGQNGDWLNFREPHRLIERIDELAEAFDKEQFTSVHEPSVVGAYRRRPATLHPKPPNWVPGQVFDADKGEQPYDGEDKATDHVGQAISRAFIARAKPWLIPELYHPEHRVPKNPWDFVPLFPVVEWLRDLERFIADLERELRIVVGAGEFSFTDDDSGKRAYRAAVHAALQATTRRETIAEAQRRVYVDFVPKVTIIKTEEQEVPRPDIGPYVTVTEKVRVPREYYRFRPRLLVPGSNTFIDADSFPHSEMTKYWLRATHSKMREVYASKPDSDMGLCHLIRILYLFGGIPEDLKISEDQWWRKRTGPDAAFHQYFDNRAEEKVFTEDPALAQRLSAARAKLTILLEQSAQVPRSPDLTFSPIAQEVLRNALQHYKFWLDEPLQLQHSPDFRKLRSDLGYDNESEMEYWSENHFIMFASSEYLAGQLWDTDLFQPGSVFLRTPFPGSDKTGQLRGEQRRERGRARLLRWLNHRLQFGWTEFNSSGYYREHLWSLLNLVDFALDPEIRQKATMAADLLLFDVARFLHKGSMGAAGGRSQFGSKVSGRDNALSDAIEILFGARGVFYDGDSEIGAALATSTYRIPEVLLEIVANPPQFGFTDRSRVSITFDEAYKYGIWFSQQEDKEKFDAIREGYQPKLDKYLKFVGEVYDKIEQTHPTYNRYDDSIAFWWSTSAFLNKQVTVGTLDAIKKYGLEQAKAFKQLAGLVSVILPKLEGGSLFGAIGGLIGGVYGAIAGALIGYFTNGDEDAEEAADEMSVFLEGSTRTRANIITYRNPDIMLSSIQNFRAGQMNVQSNVQQATVNGTLNIFSTAGFSNLDVSPLLAAAAGAGVGRFAEATLTKVYEGLGNSLIGKALPVAGAVAGVVANEKLLTGYTPFDDDGVSWWTGYWALPMVVQSDGAAIIAYDFHDIQDDLADAGSHFFFPKAGFDSVDELRSSAYDDANSPLFENFDVFHYGPKGFWVFGKYIHQDGDGPAADRPEAYIGVFSNQHPTWLSLEEDEVDVYRKAVREVGKDKIDELAKQIRESKEPRRDLEKAKRELERIWPDPLPRDYFADRDWHHDGKNIWIVQVGSKAEYGDYETFKQRVSSARVHLDDTGDMECHYHAPMPGGGSKVLALKYEEQEFHYGNAPLQTDLYPRFENPFVRGGKVEWNQRSYVIEYRGHSLLHDLHNFNQPIRTEKLAAAPEDADKVLGLVIFVRTKDEDMDDKTLGVATVEIGCTTVTTEQIIAVGPVDDDHSHDTEWIFFDSGPVTPAPDLTIDVGHRAFSDGDDEADWNMGFSMQALMGDHTLRDCVLNWDSSDFDEDVRNTGRLPFAIRTDRWRPWEAVPDSAIQGAVVQGTRPALESVYYDHCDLLITTATRPARHRRLGACRTVAPQPADIPAGPDAPVFPPSGSVRAVSRYPGHLVAAAAENSKLYLSAMDRSGKWLPWAREQPEFGTPIPIASGAKVHIGPSRFAHPDGVELVFAGADGHLWALFAWHPPFSLNFSTDQWYWQQLQVDKFTLRTDGDFAVTANSVFALDTNGAIWATPLVRAQLLVPKWAKLGTQQAFRTFTVVTGGERERILATTEDGHVWDCDLTPGQPQTWVPIALPPAVTAAKDSGIAAAFTEPTRLDAVIVGSDGIVYTTTWRAPAWSACTPVGQGEQGFHAVGTPILVHRVKRQLELLVRTEAGDLRRSWWS